VIFRPNILPMLDFLTGDECKMLLKAAIGYRMDGKTAEFSGPLGMAWAFLAPQIDEDKAAYLSEVERRSLAGKAGAAGRWGKDNDANACERIPEHTTVYDCIPSNAIDGRIERNRIEGNINNSFVTTPTGVGDEEKPKRAKKQREPFDHNSNPYKCAAYLNEAICERLNVESKPEATLQSWADAFDKCHRIDHRPWKELEVVLRWSQEDSFWQQNILSGSKFRKQYETLLSKAKGEGVFVG